jgi:hypothetical protein
MEYEHRARPLWPRSLSMRLRETDARSRRPPQQPPPLSRVGYHVDRRCHLSLAAFDSTMSCRTHPVQYRINRWLGSPVFRRPKTANGSATGAPVSREHKIHSQIPTLFLEIYPVKESSTKIGQNNRSDLMFFGPNGPQLRLLRTSPAP